MELDSAQGGQNKIGELFKDSKNKQSQTKEEQEALLAKAQTYATKGDSESFAQITAMNVDFSKSIEDQNPSGKGEVSRFECPCYCCDKTGFVQMCFSSIPFFKEIIIIAFVCDHCGYRNSEIKEGGGMSEKAKKITIKVEKPEDLNRDIFKSGSCYLRIQELDFEMEPGTLGSCYTTIEGMVNKIADNLAENNPFGQGDSANDKKFTEFIAKLRALTEVKEPFTLILDDPADNCFIYNPFAPNDDPQITIEVYERTQEQNDELGITDMKTENYQ